MARPQTMRDSADFLPTASLRTLRLRADMLHWMRGFFRDDGYWEVQTPVLSHDVCVDAWLEPFAVPLSDRGDQSGGGGNDRPCMAYLQTSPEFAMKRLIVAGAEAIFQIGPAFRVGESGPLHNPEFTMVEWYRVGDTYHDQMAFTERLAAGFVEEIRGKLTADNSTPSGPYEADSLTISSPIPRMTYDAMFELACEVPVLASSMAELHTLARRKSVIVPDSLSADDRDGWLNLLLADVVEPVLAEREALFVCDYPASQAALARIRNDNPPVAERFELYLRGVEICNGYQELTDADELRRRIGVQSQLRKTAGLPELPSDSRLLKAMDAGLADCSGVALGFDRLLMMALGAPSIDHVLPFPFDRA